MEILQEKKVAFRPKKLSERTVTDGLIGHKYVPLPYPDPVLCGSEVPSPGGE